MQDYTTFDQTSSADWQAWMDYAADMTRYPVHHDDAAHTDYSPLQTVLRPCRNLDCANRSYALFCSEACRLVIEPDDTDDRYYSDGEGVLLGDRQMSDTQWQADQAAGGFAAMVCGVQSQPAAPVPALPEAAASATVRLTIAGHSDVLFTVRDHSETRLLERLEALLQRFPVQAPAQSPPVETGEHFCAMHQVRMRLNIAKNGGKDWYSHRVSEGQFCKGKAVHHG